MCSSKDCVYVLFQQLLKDPKVSLAVLNPYVKRSIKAKSLSDITTKEKFSPLTANLMSAFVRDDPTGPSLNTCVGVWGTNLVSQESKEDMGCPGTEVVGGCEPPYGCWTCAEFSAEAASSAHNH